MTKISLITIGNEVLLGKTVNTNLSFIGERLSLLGLPLMRSATIRDNEQDIWHTLNKMWSENDVLITTGGLGPTIDDVTKKTIARFFHKDVIFQEEIWQKIQSLFKQRNLVVPEINRSQAMVPRDFQTIDNDYGTAPGLHYQIEDKNFFALPGVPSEMKPMMTNYIIPFLKKYYPTRPFYQKTIRTFGITESALSEKLSDVKMENDIEIAFLPQLGKVDIRVYGFNQQNFQETISSITKRISDYIYGHNNETILLLLHNKLLSSKLTLSIAESCTGGLIQSQVTSNPGSSNYFLGGLVSYSNEVKMNLLKLRENTLKRYGAVSRETAFEMVKNVQQLFSSDLAIAVTGIAGPGGGTREKPIGLVYVGVNIKGEISVKEFHFSGSRVQIQKKTAENALYLLLRKLNHHSN